MCKQDGRPTQKLVDYYINLVKGGVGLIISGYTYVRPDGKQLPGKMGIYTDTLKDDFIKLTTAVHDHGGKIAIQLVHAGGQADSKAISGPTVAPSAVKVDQFPEEPKELTTDDITNIVDAFAMAAKRAKDWGFDAVQIHGAHGYLINQFLSPLTNRRNDEYGGTIEERSRFLFDVYDKIRSKLGKDYPVFIKLNAADNLDGGLELKDALNVAKKLSDKGIDAIEVSSGTPASDKKGPARTKIKSPDKEGYNLKLASKIKEVVQCPVISVGGFRSLNVAEKAIKNQNMDFIALSRPLIREPDLPNQWAKNKKDVAKCISCNKCFIPGLSEGGIYCVPQKKEKNKKGKSKKG